MTTLQVNDTPPGWVEKLIVIARERSRAAAHFDATDASELVASTLAAIPIASSEATSVTLANGIQTAWIAHRADTAQHTAADTANATGASAATNLATAETLAIELKADFNAHIKDAALAYHRVKSFDLVESADPSTDQTACNLLCNELQAKLCAHIRNGAKTLPSASSVGGA